MADLHAGSLGPDERAELERLRAQANGHSGRGGRTWRWVGATALLLVGAILGTLAVVAVYVRSEVLDTETYVETVAPLGSDPAVRDAIAARLTDEIIVRSDVEKLATDLATRLEQQGAPERISDLVGPLVGGVRSFLNGRIVGLMSTPRFETAWQNINRVGHTGLVTVLTGGQGEILTSEGNTVTIDIGELLTLVKQQLVADGLEIFGRIPDVSIQYPLITSDQLPTIRTYTRLLDTVGTWLPWIALLLLLGGVILAPNRRRGVIVAMVLLGIVTALTLLGVTTARTYYLDNLPPTVRSPEAAAVVVNTMLRFLIASLQTLLVVTAIFLIGALLAGPSSAAVAVRRLLNYGMDAAARGLRHVGTWIRTTGRALAAAYHPIRVAIVLVALAAFIAANRPGVPALLWTTVIVVLLLALLEILVRTGTRGEQPGGVSRPAIR
jgi:hypothetical protein